VGLTVAEFLDRYYTSYVEAEGLRSSGSIHGRLKAAKRSLGDMPVTALEKARAPESDDRSVGTPPPAPGGSADRSRPGRIT
jgi:hypothetical protein